MILLGFKFTNAKSISKVVRDRIQATPVVPEPATLSKTISP